MNRRNFMGAGAATMAALGASASSGVARAKSDATTRGIIVDGCSPTMLSRSYLELLKSAGVGCWHVDMGGRTALAQLSLLHTVLDQNRDLAELARSVEDIRRIHASGRIALVFGWQAVDSIEDPQANNWQVNPPRTAMRAYYELGLRCVGLVYNLANSFGGGCLDPRIGLTKAGRFLVEEMQKMGILVDCGGHTGEQTSLDIIAMAQRPVVCTHSNVLALNDNPRNTSDGVIEGIARTGGVFCVSAIDPFMTWNRNYIGKSPDTVPRAGISRMVDEFDHLKRLVGVDHIGLGPDFTHGAKGAIDPDVSFAFPPEMTYRQDPIQYVQGFEDMTKLPDLEKEMRRRGWSDEDLRKVLGENLLRVFSRAWG